MSKKEILQEVTVNTPIYDPDLPQKAAAALVDAPLELGPNEGLRLEILFNKNVYQQAAFYQYELTMEHKGPAPKTEKEKTKQKIYDVLSEQLGKVSAALKENGCVFRDTAIIGDDLEDDAVHITLYRQETSMVDKGKRQMEIHTNSIMPDRPFIIKQASEVLSKIYWERMQKDIATEAAKRRHIPNFVSAGKFFTAISIALSEEIDTELTADKLIANASMESGWPLRICKKDGIDREEVFTENTQIDCPEYIIFHLNHDGNWRLEKLENLRAAQYIIAKEGFRRKRTQAIIVLKDLKKVPYALFADTEDGLIPVSPNEAHGYKKLLVNWRKNT